MAEAQTSLKKTIKPSQAWALALGAILGWGAFVLPALRFLPTAGPLASCIGFALGGIMLLFVAMSYGDMIGKYPVAGGEFVFAYVGFGPTAAFVCGWALALGYICIIALNASALALLFRFLLPGVFEVGYLYTIVGWDVYAGELAMLVAILVGSGWINYRGADLVGKIQVFLAIALVGGVFALFAGTTLHETSSISNLFPLYAEHRSPMASIMAIVAIAPWLYVGFDTIPQAAEEFDFPHEMATKLMITAIICGVFLYAMVTLAVAGLMPYKELLALDVPWATGHIAHLSLGKAGSVILAMAVSAAIFTGINGFFIASSRLLFSIGRARILPSWFGDIHPKYGTPHKAIVFVTLLTIIAPFFGREVLNWVVDMSAVGTVIGYLFTCLAAYKVAVAFRSEETSSKKIIFAALGSVSSVICILLLTVPGSPGSIGTESWMALVLWTLLGAFFYKMKMGEFKGLDLKTQRKLMMGGIDLPVFFKK